MAAIAAGALVASGWPGSAVAAMPSVTTGSARAKVLAGGRGLDAFDRHIEAEPAGAPRSGAADRRGCRRPADRVRRGASRPRAQCRARSRRALRASAPAVATLQGRLSVLDHGLVAQFLEIFLGLVLERFVDTAGREFPFWPARSRTASCRTAHRSRRLARVTSGGGQLAELGLGQNVAQRRRQVGRGLDHRADAPRRSGWRGPAGCPVRNSGKRARSASASFLRASNAAGGDPRGTTNRIGRSV